MDASVNRIPSSRDERTLIITIRLPGLRKDDLAYSRDELALLVKTAGGVLVETKSVRRDKIDAAYIVGKGYVAKLKLFIDENDIRLVVFDLNSIRPAQVRNLEERLGCRVVGRSEVIMDIFARRARSAEAKIQVEVAQLKYILPRLKGLGGVLSRLGGGIGTRGPGEKMLESDRRHILRRITTLNRKLKGIQKHRALARKSRTGMLKGAVVGYTNAGKSTLINNLAKDDLFVEDRLFATLDSYTRTVYLGTGKNVLLTDTIGFIRNLPADLIESFRSTLEEIRFADFLIHVVDLLSPDIAAAIDVVHKELVLLEANDKPLLFFFNKSDRTSDLQLQNSIRLKYPEAVIGSARTGEGLPELVDGIRAIFNS